MTPIHVMTWDETGGQGPPAVFVHNIFTWGCDETYGFAAQRPLADRYRLLLVDRRGYGHSPDTARSDFEADADDLIALLAELPNLPDLSDPPKTSDPSVLPEPSAPPEPSDVRNGGAHLVGHGNGGVAAMLAAARRPDLVRSLTLIQPSAFTVAARHPAVAALLERVGEAAPGVPDSMTAQEFLRASTEGIGLPMPQPTAQRLRAVATSMHERPIWEAQVPLEPLRTAPWPTLVICGTWQDAPEPYRTYVGEPLMACAEAVTEALGVRARLLRVPGFYPHTQQPAAVNTALRQLWA
ncbi:alpha/beta fold hydrolase [Streptomyces sp. YGL11-2]|uniref:alpha/beta fold hydrolase n=1 Tax=Streptomyces sp. YGL11-2 TaxID=3414028 RepID=UPI003CEE71AD